MEKQQNIREILGLTQDELALLFRISRSQMAKYELGKRDLSITARYLLAEMLGYMNNPEASSKTSSHILRQQADKQDTLKKMLDENKFQLARVARKINAIEKKYTYLIKTVHLGDFLVVKNTEIKWFVDVVRNISNKASKALKVYGLSTLIKYEIKLEVLQHEKLLIESKLNKI